MVLFGSVARGEWNNKSDIDILSVVPEKEDEITSLMNKAAADIGPLLHISPITTTVEKFREGFKGGKEFYENLWKDRIVLYNEFLFWQLIKEGDKQNA
jgi:predicted nucleotidyltransferase